MSRTPNPARDGFLQERFQLGKHAFGTRFSDGFKLITTVEVRNQQSYRVVSFVEFIPVNPELSTTGACPYVVTRNEVLKLLSIRQAGSHFTDECKVDFVRVGTC